MADNSNRVSEGEIERVSELVGLGWSSREIQKDVGRSRNTILCIIARHVRPAGIKTTPTEKHRVHIAGSSLFAEPSKPRRFSFEDQS